MGGTPNASFADRCKKMPRAIRTHPLGAEHPTFESINRLAREYERKEYFDGAWALRPVELVSFGVKMLNP